MNQREAEAVALPALTTRFEETTAFCFGIRTALLDLVRTALGMRVTCTAFTDSLATMNSPMHPNCPRFVPATATDYGRYHRPCNRPPESPKCNSDGLTPER